MKTTIRNAEQSAPVTAVPGNLRAVLAMVLQALDLDAAEGRAVRGEMAAELRAAMEAQSAPAGEREAFEAWVLGEWPHARMYRRDALPEGDPLRDSYVDEWVQRAWVGWQARAAWQRTQSAGVPEGADAQIGAVVWRYIDRMTDICTEDPAERILEQFVAEVRPIMLAAAPAQPAAQSVMCHGCFAQGVGPDHFDAAGKCKVMQPAAHDQGEVQRLREALEEVRSVIDAREMPSELALAALSNMIDAALAASTGQEVEE